MSEIEEPYFVVANPRQRAWQNISALNPGEWISFRDIRKRLRCPVKGAREIEARELTAQGFIRVQGIYPCGLAFTDNHEWVIRPHEAIFVGYRAKFANWVELFVKGEHLDKRAIAVLHRLWKNSEFYLKSRRIIDRGRYLTCIEDLRALYNFEEFEKDKSQVRFDQLRRNSAE